MNSLFTQGHKAVIGLVVASTLGWLGAAPAAAAEANSTPVSLEKGLSSPYAAPDFTGLSNWINSAPLTTQGLRGKVVLIDFWAYSCINCLRTLPYLTEWDKKYRDQGLVIIGMHAPEFEFEQNADNVRRAVKKFKVRYPVALDNQLATWKAFNNRYWPAHYLIDQAGRVVYTHFGEGEYERTENNIRRLLGLAPTAQSAAPNEAFNRDQTPETYLGYFRADSYDGPVMPHPDTATYYRFAETLDTHDWTLNGNWVIEGEKIVSGENATLRLHFAARKVYLVLGSRDGKPHHVTLTLDGKPVAEGAGADAPGGMLTVDHHRLYELIDLKHFGNGTLDIHSDTPGLEAYAFTFGS